jgi:hypothetical protein
MTQASQPAIALTADEAMELIAFLVSAAETSLVEPTHYGSFRLIDAASRVMGHMLVHDANGSAEFLRRFKAEIDQKKSWMMWDPEGYFAFLREAPARVAAEMKRRAEPASGEGERP